MHANRVSVSGRPHRVLPCEVLPVEAARARGGHLDERDDHTLLASHAMFDDVTGTGSSTGVGSASRLSLQRVEPALPVDVTSSQPKC